jgi:hypothetical protein
VVHPDQFLAPEQTQHARRNYHTLQRGTHSRSLGEANAVHIVDGYSGFLQCLLYKLHNPRAVVARCILGQKPLAWWGDIGVTDIGEDLRGAAILRMQHDTDAQLVSRAFHADCDHDRQYVRVSGNM